MNYLETAIEVLKKIESNGFEAYIVGGFVRDYLLKIDSNDIDITTSASIGDLQKIFEHISLKGEKYDGIIVCENSYEFEITSFRHDLNYMDHRHPIVEKANTLEEDLIRRDFTINALCLDSTLSVLDYHNGLTDLNKKTIRTIGDPNRRFNEDALRILRAFYFSSKLDFDIDENTLKGIENCAKFLSFLSSDRISEELSKILKQMYYKKGLNYLIKTGCINYLNGLVDAIKLIINSDYKFNFLEVLALSTYLKNDVSFYKLSSKDKKFVQNVSNIIGFEFDNYILFSNDIEVLKSANKINQMLNFNYLEDLEYKKENLKLKCAKDLAIKGSDLVGLVENKEISESLNYLIRLVLDSKIENNKEKLIDEIKRRK